MLKSWFMRGFVGLCFALPMGFLAVAVAQAGSPMQETSQDECRDCHEIIQTHWTDSAHGHAADDEVFTEAWQAQGSPQECLSCHTTGFDPETGTWQAEGVSCTVCHYPTSENHPEQVMPTDISSRLCGKCHLDTYAEWEVSTHGQEELACVRCHNPHTTALKKSDAQEVCQACHNQEAHFYNYTGHAEEGLLCADCHLRVSDGEMGEGHGQRLHTFVVDVETCTGCHGDNLHYPTGDESASVETVEASALLPIGRTSVSTQPNPVSPMGFAVVAALVGMGSGMILAPWLEKWYRRAKNGRGTE
jgi:hypothetical protein